MPKKAGTEKHPRPIAFRGRLSLEPPRQELPILAGGRLLVPRGIVFNGGDYPTCSRSVMSRDKSVKNCPRRSIMGNARGIAFEPDFGVNPTVVFLNGGAGRLWAFTAIYDPALAQAPIAIHIRPLRSRKWAYELSFETPKSIQVVAGVPFFFPSLSFNVGLKPYARRYVVVDRACPPRGFMGYRGDFSFRYPDDSVVKTDYRGRIACA